MALKSGRVGVRQDQVDVYGRPISTDFFNELLEDLPVWVEVDEWKNGTEQLLPSNDDEPETSPIKMNMLYPDDVLRENQYFTYRESPTTKDGTGKIKDIKGSTLVWNQLVNNGNFSSGTTYWSGNLGTLTSSNGVATLTINSSEYNSGYIRLNPYISLETGHKYAYFFDVMSSVATTTSAFCYGTSASFIKTFSLTANTWTSINGIFEATGNQGFMFYLDRSSTHQVGDTFNIKKVNVFDFTKMFGSGNEPTTVDQFKALFPLDYYAYNTGSLLSFTGIGLHTIGKSYLTLDSSKWGNYGTNTTGYEPNVIRLAPQGYTIPFEKGTEYTLYLDNYYGSTFKCAVNFYNATTRIYDSGWKDMPFSFTPTSETVKVTIVLKFSNDANMTAMPSEIGKTLFPYIVEDSQYSTTSLPISTFFPTGMKSAGTVYDELTPTRAITRIGSVDLGSLEWNYSSGSQYFVSDSINSLIQAPTNNNTVVNVLSSLYKADTYNNVISSNNLSIGVMGLTGGTPGRIKLINTAYTDSTEFTTAMSGIYLFYELKTEVVEPTMSFEESH